MKLLIAVVGVMLPLFLALAALAEDAVFSGPQPGEKLARFKIRGVLHDGAGKEIDLIEQADGQPVVIIFVHQLTRPSVGTLRTVMNYAAKQAKEHKLTTGVVFLGEDATATEEQIKRAGHAMPRGVAIGISTDGGEGPGAYGLNRKMTLTVLVGKENKVTANFPLVQPSEQADAPKIAAAIAKVIGVKPPSREELAAASGRSPKAKRPATPSEQDPNLRSLLVPVINKDATREQVDEAAEKLEAYLAKNPKSAKHVGQIANRIIDGGVLDRYGTPAAQEYLKKWAKKYGK